MSDRPIPCEVCELCDTAVEPAHPNLLEVASRKIICVCKRCAHAFQSNLGGRFKLIPGDTWRLMDFRLTDAQWEAFRLPVELVFMFYSTAAGRMMVMYPSSDGLVESILPRETWKMLIEENPALEDMKPDVEALLIDRTGATPEYSVAPIDVCHEMAGLIRRSWRVGFSNAETVCDSIEKTFSRTPDPSPAVSATDFQIVSAEEKVIA